MTIEILSFHTEWNNFEIDAIIAHLWEEDHLPFTVNLPSARYTTLLPTGIIDLTCCNIHTSIPIPPTRLPPLSLLPLTPKGSVIGYYTTRAIIWIPVVFTSWIQLYFSYLIHMLSVMTTNDWPRQCPDSVTCVYMLPVVCLVCYVCSWLDIIYPIPCSFKLWCDICIWSYFD